MKIEHKDFERIAWSCVGEKLYEIKFCAKCSKKLHPIPLNKYDKKTGERLYNHVCTTMKCGHTGWKHSYKARTLRARFRNNFYHKSFCTHCGETW